MDWSPLAKRYLFFISFLHIYSIKVLYISFDFKRIILLIPGLDIFPVSSSISLPSRKIACLSESGSKSGLLIINGSSSSSEPTKGKVQNKLGEFFSKKILFSLSNSMAVHILTLLSFPNFSVNLSLCSLILKNINFLLFL